MPADTLIAAVPGQTGIYLNIPIARFMLPGSTTMFGEFHYEQHPCRKHNPPPIGAQSLEKEVRYKAKRRTYLYLQFRHQWICLLLAPAVLFSGSAQRSVITKNVAHLAHTMHRVK